MGENYVWRLYIYEEGLLWSFVDFEEKVERTAHIVDYLDSYRAVAMDDGFPFNLPDVPTFR